MKIKPTFLAGAFVLGLNSAIGLVYVLVELELARLGGSKRCAKGLGLRIESNWRSVLRKDMKIGYGGIGFTKQNELFVGRVAMIGFAASLLGEAVTGKGILQQLNLETGIPIYEAEPLLLFFILFTLLGAIGALGDRGRFVDEPTGLDKAVIPPGKGFRSALGLSEGGPLFGFTKSNELFVGRLAQLGIAFSLIGEIITGKGALAQLNIETGLPISEIEPLVLFNVAFFFVAALNPGTGKFVTDEDED
ncbi:photosystem II 22 kDa protein, chloroplastic [Tanacetum coccineum]|uniref:Photosystem II 22 kDa protein, chloroplastic n=1 Tax=Tanacetum coccineum TaxID=301880 RepID=A0ABQ5FLC6_9ASTR